MRNSISSKKEIISTVVAIIIGIIAVAIMTYLIPFDDMYDTVVVNNVNLTKSAIFSKFVLKSSFIMITIFMIGYFLVKIIFKLPEFKDKNKSKVHVKKEKIHTVKKHTEQKLEVENIGSMSTGGTKTIQFKAPILNDYTKFQAAQGEDYIRLYDDDEDLF